jgi:acetyl esterase/lipase
VLFYPVISMQNERLVHPDSRRRLLGSSPDPKLLADLSNDTRVTTDTPPTFLAHAADDDKVDAENSLSYCQALLRAGVPAELHLFEKGGHGFANPTKPPSLARDTWRIRCGDWMRARGLIQ